MSDMDGAIMVGVWLHVLPGWAYDDKFVAPCLIYCRWTMMMSLWLHVWPEGGYDTSVSVHV
jgi:hypothetical protein